MRGDWKKSRDGRDYQDWRYSVEDLNEEVPRWRTTPKQARRRILGIRNLFDKLLTAKTDIRRVACVNLIHRRLNHGYNRIDMLAPLSKVASMTPKEHKTFKDRMRETIELEMERQRKEQGG
jgi:hypothetical protein